ncbi:hypothetical protein HMPREF9129_1645 [Peptoniphilus indolicus ATCC 29427]|uniref:Uncharacterized protein n=1 Tax=Peptoniphilus indolicus ATCC 29427 TaxID=997350 RepID=G4D5G5_9FIRM|nr:hypothetical protein HMPREF9129_1645 [Peptoniphilus indolicus ATCC 29427]
MATEYKIRPTEFIKMSKAEQAMYVAMLEKYAEDTKRGES